MNGSPHGVASLSAWGDARPLDVALERIRDESEATVVELAIGVLPVADPFAVLDRHRDRFTYIGHHTVPLAKGAVRRPGDRPADLIGALQGAGIDRYSAHPPACRSTSERDFLTWALRWHHDLASAGISFAVETMYPPIDVDEGRRTKGHHLASRAQVERFVAVAAEHDWARPLVIDAAHLHIGWCAGVWTERAIGELLAAGHADELHVSSNDGVHDVHGVLRPTDRVWAWVAPHLGRFGLVVDEGRRRRNRGAVRQRLAATHRTRQGARPR